MASDQGAVGEFVYVILRPLVLDCDRHMLRRPGSRSCSSTNHIQCTLYWRPMSSMTI